MDLARRSGKPAGSSPWRPDRPPLTGCTAGRPLDWRVPVPGVVLPRVRAGPDEPDDVCQRWRSVERVAVALIRATISAGSRRRNGGTGIGSGMGASVFSGAVLTSGRVEPRSRGYVPQTPEVDTFTLLFVLRASRGFAAATLDGLRLDGERLHVWHDDADPTVVRASLESRNDDLDEALAHGRGLAGAMAVASPGDLAVEEVVAMDDERQLVWRAKP